ncbi:MULTISPECIES: adenylate/guanylate cyclase domain-containing protein [Bradyrhizobium]|uniref:adenylate/guanylate cyclase domain-containing protein n=2 Tax=Nitrobacteraceae TaxID=41294 RepID=UPI0004123A2C|nr:MULTISPECIES: adenylate/guanylate cyclase domain-containing protein [Bradyrhizobium]MBR0996148.1 hypothetical protein [Bradyrhizobium liaoningense]MCP1739358.1 hypothetical protein [Bradyrhizobium japonicum]MCP1857031.1 hypothetical protein [Bradyrhizobium japonicum]MCP1887846.1 hypothetical protein [Bradyrhizobium japonicum]MCW2320817.1 hypothetical protein [Bradyrhizobium japonicum]
MDLGNWLRTLGLERLEATFRENAIDETVLSDLTEDHLRELGLPLGARIKLLKAIAALPKKTTIGAPVGMAVSSSPGDAAERRQITVMFSDLVGSTALSTRMDPEDLRKLISAYQKSVTETVQRYGGFVAKYMGDGVLVYFGYPQAHEDDAERAVRSALELVPAVAKLKTNTRLQTRVGIATGLVVVGDLVGSGEAQERGIVGETPNLAARLQGLAGRVEDWRADRPLDRATFPVPSTSHAACGFPALRAPICFTPTLMGPILLGRLSARRVALCRR